MCWSPKTDRWALFLSWPPHSPDTVGQEPRVDAGVSSRCRSGASESRFLGPCWIADKGQLPMIEAALDGSFQPKHSTDSDRLCMYIYMCMCTSCKKYMCVCAQVYICVCAQPGGEHKPPTVIQRLESRHRSFQSEPACKFCCQHAANTTQSACGTKSLVRPLHY